MNLIDNLSEKRILELTETKNISVSIFDSLPSTSDLAKQRTSEGADEGVLILANNQTAGRGRTGKTFFSPDGSGIYFSLVLRPEFSPTEAYKITLAAAVALCETLETMGTTPLIKWVNDIFLGGRKVAGILTEAKLTENAEKIEYAVLGVGLNLYPPKIGFPEEIKSSAGFIWDSPLNDRKNRLVSLFIDNFFRIYKNSFTSLVENYKKRCFILGKEILILKKDNKIPASALDITECGGLRVRLQNGKEIVLDSGEISIKPL